MIIPKLWVEDGPARSRPILTGSAGIDGRDRDVAADVVAFRAGDTHFGDVSAAIEALPYGPPLTATGAVVSESVVAVPRDTRSLRE